MKTGGLRGAPSACFLWLLAVSLALAASDPDATLESFSEWFESEGGEVLGGASIHYDDSFGYHFVADRPVEAGEELVRLPHSMLLQTDELRLNLDELRLKHEHKQKSKNKKGKRKARAKVPHTPYTPEQRLALVLLQERAEGEGSYWYPYIRMLPETVPSALFFSKKHLEILSGTFAHTMALKIRSDTDAFASRVRADFPELPGYDGDAVRWAHAMVLSRAFQARDTKEVYFAPGADLMNHEDGAAIQWRYPRRGFEISTLRPYARGMQVSGVRACRSLPPFTRHTRVALLMTRFRPLPSAPATCRYSTATRSGCPTTAWSRTWASSRGTTRTTSS